MRHCLLPDGRTSECFVASTGAGDPLLGSECQALVELLDLLAEGSDLRRDPSEKRADLRLVVSPEARRERLGLDEFWVQRRIGSHATSLRPGIAQLGDEAAFQPARASRSTGLQAPPTTVVVGTGGGICPPIDFKMSSACWSVDTA